MNILRKVFIGSILIVLLLLFISFFIPSRYIVERSVVIHAPVEKIFDYVYNLEKNQLWSPWKALDPSMKVTFGNKRAGLGASYSWISEKSGNGTLIITLVKKNQLIKTELDFREKGKGKGYWTFKRSGAGIKVTEGFVGAVGINPVDRYMSLFMDSFMGPVFEKGLNALKELCEKK